MNINVLLKYAVMLLSGAAMVLGILVIIGVLVPYRLPVQFRLLSGIVVFLYGLYRFVISVVRQQKR